MAVRQGQAMIIAILSLGGAILGATTLAGILMLYNIRATTDSQNSAKAIFAADAGINWELYNFFNPGAPALGTLSDGASATVTCSAAGVTVPCDGSGGTPDSAISEGTSNGARRAFFLNLGGATSTVP